MIDLLFNEDRTVAEVVLNNPKAMNSLAPEDLTELSQAYTEAEQAGVRALLLRGEGRGFSAGRNIKGLDPRDDDATDYLANKVTPVPQQRSQFAAPTFAAVHGVCLGVGLRLGRATGMADRAAATEFG